MTAEGAAPEFFIKVKSDTLPTEIENRLQHGLNNVKDRLSKKKKSRKSKKTRKSSKKSRKAASAKPRKTKRAAKRTVKRRR